MKADPARNLDGHAVAEILSHLHSVKGDGALADLEQRIDRVESSLNARIEAYHAGRIDFETIVREAAQAETTVRAFRQRLAALRRLAGIGGAVAAPTSTVGEATFAKLIRTERSAFDLQTLNARVRAKLVAEVAQLDSGIAALKTLIGGPGPIAHDGSDILYHDQSNTHEWSFNAIGEKVARRNWAQHLVRLLDQDETTRLNVQSDLVRSALDGAGGAATVASGVRDASLIQGQWWERADEFGRLKAAGAELGQLEDRLGRIGGMAVEDYEPGSLGSLLAGKRAELAERVKAIRSAIDAARRAEVDAVISRAAAGDEPARVALLAVVRSVPDAFAEGLADKLEAAHFERAHPDALISALTHTATE
jgi:hypothetical protein